MFFLCLLADSHKHKDKYKDKEHKHKDHKKDKEREKSKYSNRYVTALSSPVATVCFYGRYIACLWSALTFYGVCLISRVWPVADHRKECWLYCDFLCKHYHLFGGDFFCFVD